MQLPTETYILLWVLLTTEHGRSDEIPEPTQKVAIILDSHEDSEPSRGARLAPLYDIGSHRRLLSHYGHGSTGIHHDLGGLVTAHHGLGVHRGLMPVHSHDLGNICGRGYHGGLLNGHHSFLSRHGARQASSDDIFIPPNKFIFYGHPERTQISGNAPVIHTLSAGQGFGMPVVQTNEFYKPGLGFNVTGINNYPITRLWNYPGVVHEAGVKGLHGAGMGMYYGAGTPEQYSKGISGPHAGWRSTFHELNNIHGTAGVSKYNSGIGLNGFQRIGVQGGEIGGSPVKGIPWYYGQVVDHGVMGASVMGTHKDMPTVHGFSSPGYGNTMRGYHAGINKGYQGLANVHNPELHTVMHVDGTGIYHGGSGYHKNGYHGMNGYHTGGYNGGSYHGGGYNGGGYHGGGHYGGGYHRGGYNGGGYHGGGYNGGGYHRGGYNGGGYHGGGYYGSGYHRGGYDGVGYNGDGYEGGLYHENGNNGNRYHRGGYNRMDGYHGSEDHGMNGYYESGHHNNGITEHHGSFKFGGNLQWPMLNGKGNKSDDKREADQNSKYSVLKGETHLNQDKQDKVQKYEKDSSEHRNQMPNKNGKFSASEMVENGTEDANYKMKGNNEITLFPEDMGNGSKETENGTSVTPSYGVVQPKLVEQKNVIDDDFYNTYSGYIVRDNKTNDMEEEISKNYTEYDENMSEKTEPNISTSTSSNFVHEMDMSVAAFPSTLSNTVLYATPYARGLHIDLLPQQTAALHVGSGVQLPGGTGVKGAQTGGTDLKGGGSRSHCNSKQQHQQILREPGRLLGSITDKLVGVGLGLEGYQSKDNVDGKLWTGYDSHMYDHHGVDFGYGSAPLLYQPWYYDYGQYYMTPYHRVHSDHGYDVRQFGVDGSGFVTIDNNLGLNGKLGVGLL